MGVGGRYSNKDQNGACLVAVMDPEIRKQTFVTYQREPTIGEDIPPSNE